MLQTLRTRWIIHPLAKQLTNKTHIWTERICQNIIARGHDRKYNVYISLFHWLQIATSIAGSDCIAWQLPPSVQATIPSTYLQISNQYLDKDRFASCVRFYYRITASKIYPDIHHTTAREIRHNKMYFTDWIMRAMSSWSSWASYQICKIAGCACAGNAGNVFPATAG